jgi:hypothetical protein
MGPCQNKECPSYGQEHPNCRCFAEGGEVTISPDDVEVSPQPQSVAIPDSDVEIVGASPEISPDDVEIAPAESKYQSGMQKGIAVAEAMGRGIAGPLATGAERLLGVPEEDIRGRIDENKALATSTELGTFAASMYFGVGEAGLLAKGAGALAKASGLGKIGTTLLKGAIETASFAGSDEITKALIGKGDPEHPVSSALLNVGFAGIMGATGAGVFTLGRGIMGAGLEKITNAKMVERFEKLIEKIAGSGDPLKELGVTRKAINYLTASGAASGSAVVTAKTGNVGLGLMAYEPLKKALQPTVEKITGKAASKANPYITDAFIKSMLTNSASGLPNAIHYATEVAKGMMKTNNALDLLFKAGAPKAADPITQGAKDMVRSFIEDGQVDKQLENTSQELSQPQSMFAKGGEVTKPENSNHFATIFPEQNTLLNTAKARISGYLNSIRPLPYQSKLPFDSRRPDKIRERTYDNAIEYAVNPMKILHKMNSGRLTLEDMKHFTSMYPEVHRTLSTQITKRIIEAQLAGEKPSYAKRQAMSLFLGAPLDSSFTPASIQAAQAVFQKKKAMQQPPMPGPQKKGSGNKMALGKSTIQSTRTDDQARLFRQQSPKV